VTCKLYYYLGGKIKVQKNVYGVFIVVEKRKKRGLGI
jgi:hypothetical protein